MKKRGWVEENPKIAPKIPASWCLRLYNPFPWVQVGPVNVMKSVIFMTGLQYMTGDETVTLLIREHFIRPNLSRL